MPAQKAPPNRKQAPRKKASARSGLLSEVQVRKQYYKDGAGFARTICVSALIVFVVAIGVALYSIQKKAENRYLATDPQGRIIKLIPLSKPNQSEAAVRSWMVDALVNTFDFNYLNYRTSLNESAGRYFTSRGGTELVKALDNIDLLDSIAKRKLLVALDITSSPVLISHGAFGSSGLYGWQFQAKGLITLRNETAEFTIPVILGVTVSRRSLLSDPKGLGIARVFIERDRNVTQ